VIEEVKKRYCGYCKTNMFLNEEQFMKHLEWCEVDCCDRYYGGLSGKH
jgi:hypothetical protein